MTDAGDAGARFGARPKAVIRRSPSRAGRVPLPVLWRFAVRELGGARHGIATLWICLMLGVGAIAASGSVNSVLKRDLESDARAILGGDLRVGLTHREATDQELATLRSEGRVSHYLEMRSMARRADDPAQHSLVELKAVDAAYPLVGELTLSEGELDEALAFANGIFGAAVAPELAARLGLSPGARIRVGEAEFEVRAFIDVEPDQVVSFASFGPRVMLSEAGMLQTSLVEQGALLRHFYTLALPNGVSPDVVRARLDATHPHAGWRISGVEDAVQGLGEVFDNIALFFSLTGLTTLLIGGIGVANAVRSYLDRRTTTIAALKCLGASHASVTRIYALQVALIATAAILSGLLVGAAVPWLATRLFPDFMPATAGLSLAPAALGHAAIFGALTTACFTLLPLARLRAISPALLVRGAAMAEPNQLEQRAAMFKLMPLALLLGLYTVQSASNPKVAAGFVVAVLLAFTVLRAAAFLIAGAARALVEATGIARGRPAVRIGLSNLYRPGALTVSVVLSLGLGLTVLVAVAQIETNLKRQINDRLPDEAPSTFFLDLQPDQVETFEGQFKAMHLPGADLELAPMIRGRISAVNGVPVAEAQIDPAVEWAFNGDRGLSYSALPVPNADMVAGDWWPADYSGPNLVSMDAAIAEGAGLSVGDTITINVLGREVTAQIANLREIRWQSARMNFTFVYNPAALLGAPVTFIATLYADEADARDFETQAIAAFPNITAISVAEAIARVDALLSTAARVVRLIASVALVAGLVVLASAIAAGQRQRLYEAVVLKVLGGTRRRLLSAYLLEFGLLGVGTGLFAVAAGSVGASLVMTHVMKTGFTFAPLVASGVILCGILVVLLAGAGSMLSALTARPLSWLRND